MKRKLLTAGLSAVLALSMAACADGDDPVDGGVTDDTAIGDTLAPGGDTTAPGGGTTATTIAP